MIVDWSMVSAEKAGLAPTPNASTRRAADTPVASQIRPFLSIPNLLPSSIICLILPGFDDLDHHFLVSIYREVGKPIIGGPHELAAPGPSKYPSAANLNPRSAGDGRRPNPLPQRPQL